MEHLPGSRKTSADRRAESLDRSHAPRKGSESWNCQCISLPTAPARRALRRTASDEAMRPQSPEQPAEAQGPTVAALTVEESMGFLSSEQQPPQDAKKDKAQKGWLKMVLNFFLRNGHEEPKEKVSRRPKGKEGLPLPSETPEAAGEQAISRKAHEKKASRKKHSQKKHSAEETPGAQDQEARGQGTGLPGTAAVLRSREAGQGPTGRGEQTLGGEDADPPQSSLPDGAGAGAWDSSAQATVHPREEELRKLDKDAIIQMIVELLRRVGDQWEEEQLQASQSEARLQKRIPPLVSRRRSSKRGQPHKKLSFEEPKGAGAAQLQGPEAGPPRRPTLLSLHVGSQRPSFSSSPGSEEPQVPEALSPDGGSLSPPELPTQTGSGEPEEELHLDRASEYKFIQKIIALLQDAEEQESEKQPQVQEAEVAAENPAPVCRRKSQERKSSLKRAFSYKKHGPKEPKRVGSARATSPDTRPTKRPSLLCVGGHRSSISSSSGPEGLEFQEPLAAEGGPAGLSEVCSQTRSHRPEGGPPLDEACESKERIIQKLVALLQEVDGKLGKQIRRYPSFKRFFYEFSDASLRKLVATLRSQATHTAQPDRNFVRRLFPFSFGSATKFPGNNTHAVCSLMGLRGRHGRPDYVYFPYKEGSPNIASPDSQGPD
ncbi:uncharacterized protein C6orf222 homolog isoform X2 [Tupaia chinensis]|uniref:uncharacterized protein C6orf222 homolog isoform X2 n=1 Tax=Tupaia chinensis TaxID=246437 RepID=UPI000FFBACC4|nr:uncharacterized protein C6orf222 homolog isoform X2 [Tupaia chinensis]